jgi:hypothetical protein
MEIPDNERNRSPSTLDNLINIWQSSRHVESLSTWHDDPHLLLFVAVRENTATCIIMGACMSQQQQ